MAYIPPEEYRRIVGAAISSGRIKVNIGVDTCKKTITKGPRKKPCRHCHKYFMPTYKANTLCSPKCKRERFLMLKKGWNKTYRSKNA